MQPSKYGRQWGHRHPEAFAYLPTVLAYRDSIQKTEPAEPTSEMVDNVRYHAAGTLAYPGCLAVENQDTMVFTL